MLNQLIERATKPEREGIELAVIGAAQAPNLMAQLKQKNITVQRSRRRWTKTAIGELLRDAQGGGGAAPRPTNSPRTTRRCARRGSSCGSIRPPTTDRAQRDIEDVLDAYSSNIAGARLLAHGVSPATLAPVKVQRYDTGSNACALGRPDRRHARHPVLPGLHLRPVGRGRQHRRRARTAFAGSADGAAGARLGAGRPANGWRPARWRVIGVTLELVAGARHPELAAAGGNRHVLARHLARPGAGLPGRRCRCRCSPPRSQIALAMNAKSFKEAQSTAQHRDAAADAARAWWCR